MRIFHGSRTNYSWITNTRENNKWKPKKKIQLIGSAEQHNNDLIDVSVEHFRYFAQQTSDDADAKDVPRDRHMPVVGRMAQNYMVPSRDWDEA